MSARSAVALTGARLLGAVVAFALAAEPIPEVRTPAPVVFVCRNGVAMSVWSAAYLNRLAAARAFASAPSRERLYRVSARCRRAWRWRWRSMGFVSPTTAPR
jgi:hypothetical protein